MKLLIRKWLARTHKLRPDANRRARFLERHWHTAFVLAVCFANLSATRCARAGSASPVKAFIQNMKALKEDCQYIDVTQTTICRSSARSKSSPAVSTRIIEVVYSRTLSGVSKSSETSTHFVQELIQGRRPVSPSVIQRTNELIPFSGIGLLYRLARQLDGASAQIDRRRDSAEVDILGMSGKEFTLELTRDGWPKKLLLFGSNGTILAEERFVWTREAARKVPLRVERISHYGPSGQVTLTESQYIRLVFLDSTSAR